jgi:diacylglycerol kinase
MQQQKFSIKKRLKSFKYAFKGLQIVVKEEHNARIHVFAALCAIILGFFLKISQTEWIAVIFCISLVVSMEIINSAIENIADFVSPEKHEKIRKIKDLSAAAVLVCAASSLIIALIIFIPKITELC